VTLPVNVDLRSAYSKTYSQGLDAACGPFAVCAALDCVYERVFNKVVRFDPYSLWDAVRFHRGMTGTNTGSDFESLRKALEINGVRLETDTVKGIQLARTRLTDTRFLEIKQLLAMGFPVIWEMKITPSMYSLANERDWKTHRLSADTSTVSGQHYVCIVGYDDTVGRFLVENSWGSDWADGGFFGVSYSVFQTLTESLQHINICPVNPRKIDGFSMKALMLTADKVAFSDRVSQTLFATLMTPLQTEGVQGVVNACVKWQVSDKHLEALAGWDRSTVRRLKSEIPDIDWTGFLWDQI